MLEETMKASQEAAASDPNADIPPVQRPTRQQKWKAARVKKGRYITPEAAAVAERIDALEEQATQGSFVSQRGMDILETAIGTPDHPGRVRGAPKGVVRKDIFGSASQRPSANVEQKISEAVAAIRAEHALELQRELQRVREEMAIKMREEIDVQIREAILAMGQYPRMPEQPSEEVSPVVTSGKGSNNRKEKFVSQPSDPVPNQCEDNGSQCSLYIFTTDQIKMKVAFGIVYAGSKIIHGQRIPAGVAKVTVNRVKGGLGSSPVPCPTDQVQILDEAVGQFILWPLSLIKEKRMTEELVRERPESKKKLTEKPGSNQTLKKAAEKPTSKKEREKLQPLHPTIISTFDHLTNLYAVVDTLEEALEFTIPPGVLTTNEAYKFTLDRDDIVQFLNFDMLDLAVMQLAI